jgi:hypothetical protein
MKQIHAFNIRMAPAMEMVFNNLSREFDPDKQRIQPLIVMSISPGTWERLQ